MAKKVTQPKLLTGMKTRKDPIGERAKRMANEGQMTGMLGVYLVAAELSRLGFIVSPTSRSARSRLTCD